MSGGVANRGGEGKELPPPTQNPGKFATDKEQSRAQPAIRIDSNIKL